MAEFDPEIVNAMRDSLRKILSQELVPRIEESEKSGEFCFQAHRALGEQGLLAPLFPASCGGADDIWGQLIVAEEMGFYNAGFGLSSLASTCLFGANVARTGTSVQKEKYLPSVATGEKIGCWGLTEPAVGSDATGVKTTAQKKGSHYLLNGSKTFITNAPIADYFIVIARELKEDGNPLEEGFKGGTAFILERSMKGLTTGQPFKKMGHRSSPTGEIFLENVKVNSEQVLGSPGSAFAEMKYSLDVERVIFSGLAIGMMKFCLEKTARYVLQRKQFGRAIASFQMIQDHLAKMATLTDASEKYLHSVTEKLAREGNVNKEAAMVKLFIAESLKEVTDRAVQCHGGYGYMEEYEVERYSRDSKLFEIGAGTSEIQKTIIAKQLLKDFS